MPQTSTPSPSAEARTVSRRSGLSAAGAVLCALLAVGFGVLVPGSAAGRILRPRLSWVPSLDLDLTFHLDGLSLLFALLITGVGALILIYSGGYLEGDPRLGRFCGFLLFFMASMLGLVTAGNLLLLFVFWELTSISSFLLIGFDHEREEARDAALQALLVTGAGGLALLAGLVLLGLIAGSFDLGTVLAQGETVRAHPHYPAVLALILLGAFTKSAQFPFHFWLPGAMEAPTPVSAYLHSATMVKAGLYLLARLHPVLGGTEPWMAALGTVGAVTMVVGGVLALLQTDLKRLLAYSTVSALGTLTLLLGLGTRYAVTGFLVFLTAHALYKAALFMTAGILDHETGTRDVERLGGLRRAMPLTTGVAVTAALSLAGLGPLLSFIGKELFLEALLAAPQARTLLIAAAVLAGGLFATVALLVGYRPFFGPFREPPRAAHDPPRALWLGPLLLALLGVVLGLAPGPLGEGIIAPAAGAVLGQPAPVYLALWHGFNPALALSAASLLFGLAFFLAWEQLRRALSHGEPLARWGPAAGYRAAVAVLLRSASAVTRLLQNGYLRTYLMMTLGTVVILVGYPLVTRSLPPWTTGQLDLRLHEGILCFLILAAALTAVMTRSRLTAIVALGVVGYAIALIFILFGAPDLAMTQFLIETLTVIFLVLVFYRMPPLMRRSSPGSRLRDALVAGTVGCLMTALVLLAIGIPTHPGSREFYARESLAAHGRNVVNVILVDFRSLDTLGEITVLAAAALGVYALLKLRKEEPGKEVPGEERTEEACPR